MPQLTECDIIGHCFNPDDLDPRECGRCHEMEKELMEQAVCNGKGSEREAALMDALLVALPFVEDHMDSDAYRPGVIKKASEMIRATLRLREDK